MARITDYGVKDVFALIDAGDNARLQHYLDQRPQAAGARNLSNVSAILYALYRRNHYAVRMLRDNLVSLDLWEAAALGETTTLRSLLADPATDVDRFAADGYTALQLASFFGREEAVVLLLERGADPNVLSANPSRTSALHGAAAGRHRGVAALLVAGGADVDLRAGNGRTALDTALQHDDEDLERALSRR